MIIGLGNPGHEYAKNRHNVGHLVVDQLKNSRTKELQNFRILKPDQFMNDSGIFVAQMLKTYGLQPKALFVIHDDLDIKLGEFKIQFAKGPKDHNGIKSIENELGSNEFWRVRVGIENRVKRSESSGDKYVLEDFTDEEMNVLDEVVKKIGHKLDNI